MCGRVKTLKMTYVSFETTHVTLIMIRPARARPSSLWTAGLIKGRVEMI